MKKILLLFSVAGMLAFTSCNNDDDVDYDTYSEVFDLTDVDLTIDNTGRYTALVPLDPMIYDSDVILVYRQVLDDGFWVWQQIPRTVYLSGGDEVDYDFNFTTEDVLLIADANFDLATAPEFTQNQVFRIVIVPGYFADTVDTSDYGAVMSALEEKNGGAITIQKLN